MNLIIAILTIVCLFIINTSSFIYDDDVKQSFPKTFTWHSDMYDTDALKYFTTIYNCICEINRGHLVSCHGSNCRNFPSTLNITEPLLKIKLTSITIIKRDDLLKLSNLLAFEIEANFYLSRIEPGCFRHMSKLQNLTLSSNTKLKYLDSNVFEGLVNLKILYLSKSGFTHVTDISKALPLKYLPNIYLLDITENRFHEVGPYDFLPMNGTLLKQLNMLLCQIEIIDPDCFAPLRHLTHLRLGQNLFNRTTITNVVTRTLQIGIPLVKLNLYESGLRRTSPYALFEAIGKSGLLYLNIAKNHFDSIDDDFFPDMPNLLTIDLRDCLINQITRYAFKRLPNLDTIWIGQNRLQYIPEGVTSRKLEILDIAANSNNGYSQTYFYLEENLFRNMTSLLNLQLLYNNIGLLNKNHFIGLSNLNILHLKNTSLTQFDIETFRPLENLTYLNLMNNPFSSTTLLTADVFLGLDKLEILLLGGCNIKNLTTSPSLFTHLTNLTHLGLERNGLHIISPNQLTSLSNLQTLSIAENGLTAWKEPILPHSKIRNLNAYKNQLTYITEAMLEDLQLINNFDLDENPLRCDCSLYNIVIWLRTNQMAVKIYDTEEVIACCVFPTEWHGKSIVKFLNYLKSDSTICEIFLFYHDPIFISCISVLAILIIIVIILVCKFKLYIIYWIFLARKALTKHMLNIRKPREPNATYTYDAFISYCNEDSCFVTHLVSELENNEPYFKLCMYERDFQIGSMLSETILQSVIQSKRTILVVSDAFAKSQWCRWETQLAEFHKLFFQNDNANKPDGTLIIIRLEAVAKKNLTPTLRYLMKTRIYLEWHNEPLKQEMFMEKLRAALALSKI